MSQELREVLAAQRRRRRLRFWAGLLALLIVGGLWAQLSKDPIGPQFGEVFAEPDAVVIEQGEFIEQELTTTTVILDDEDEDEDDDEDGDG
ncbi:MAG: hypothetical protein AAF547_22965 [Actinomycetota bacterium]